MGDAKPLLINSMDPHLGCMAAKPGHGPSRFLDGLWSSYCEKFAQRHRPKLCREEWKFKTDGFGLPDLTSCSLARVRFGYLTNVLQRDSRLRYRAGVFSSRVCGAVR